MNRSWRTDTNGDVLPTLIRCVNSPPMPCMNGDIFYVHLNRYSVDARSFTPSIFHSPLLSSPSSLPPSFPPTHPRNHGQRGAGMSAKKSFACLPKTNLFFFPPPLPPLLPCQNPPKPHPLVCSAGDEEGGGGRVERRDNDTFAKETCV